ncbi:MAG: hypothetical protein A2081_01305 [Elusimicrobia bacterium GWC2_61_19]|nr:MAG: hypothetical protein A2081_01305 [Elusimicrobia bacterium GWC2_61_19]
MTDPQKKFIPAILLASLLARIAYALHTGNALSYPDEGVYHNTAVAMLSAADWGGFFHNREPLYPVLVWLTYKVTGPLPLAVKLLQAAMSTCGVYLIYRTALRLFGRGAAVLALLLAALYPFSIFYDACLLRESLISFLGIAILYFALRIAPGRDRALLAASALSGLAVTAKTIFLFYWLPLLLAALLLKRTTLRAALAAAAVFTLFISPLLFHNYHATGKFFLTRGQLLNLYIPLVLPKDVIGTPRENEAIARDPVCREGLALPEAERDVFFKAKVAEELRLRPLNFAGRTGWRLLKLWRPYPHQGRDYAAGAWLFLVIVSLLSDGWLIPLGLWSAFSLRGRSAELYPAYIYLASFTVIYSLSWSQIRYRLPLMPVLIILAAGPLARAADRAGLTFLKEDMK